MRATMYNIYIIENIWITTCMAHLYTNTQNINIHEKLQFQSILLLL
jgi:hypothetical protein